MGVNVNLQRGLRSLLEQPIIHATESSIEREDPTRFMDLVFDMHKVVDLSLFKFDSFLYDGSVVNILNDFFSWLVANPQFFNKLECDIYKASYFEYKPKLISKHLYGTTELSYIITYFNDIQHDAEITRDMLMTKGIVYLNQEGLHALEKILSFKEFMEANDDESFKEWEF